MYRDHNCGELNINDVNKKVQLAGWVQRIRNWKTNEKIRKEEIKMYIEFDDNDINKLEKDLKKYFIDLHRKGNMVDVEELVGIIQDLLVELEEQKEKYDDMVDYYTNNEPDYEVY